jgi:diaminopropionate ammonia-lyase
MADDDTLVISDTSWDGYTRTPRAVIDGYSTMFREVDDESAARGWPAPTVVALQAGVGAFAAAGINHYRGGTDDEPVIAIVEPSTANCLMASAKAGRMTEVPGPHRSTMAGLNCGWPSQLAWPVVQAGTDVFVAIDDPQVEVAMLAMAEEGIVSGESGAAGLAGLLALTADRDAAAAVGITEAGIVLVVNTEGATDPVNYQRVVGRPPDEVLRGRPSGEAPADVAVSG